MHTVWVRLNAVVFFGLTVLLVVVARQSCWARARRRTAGRAMCRVATTRKREQCLLDEASLGADIQRLPTVLKGII